MRLDHINLKILWLVDYGARMPLSQLAKKVGVSKQTLNYRLGKLEEDGIITHYTSVVNTHKLGYLTYRVYIRYGKLSEKDEQQLIQHFITHDHVIWFASIVGNWDLEVVFLARNFIHFNNLYKRMREEFGHLFAATNISMAAVNYHFTKDYLIEKSREPLSIAYYGFEPEEELLDKLDTRLIEELSLNCRRSNQEIGRHLGVSYQTIKTRIQMLEKRGILQGHRAHIAVEKLDIATYKLQLKLHPVNVEKEKQLYAYMSQHTGVVYLIEVLGDWQIEAEIEVRNEKDCLELLKGLRNTFPEFIADYALYRILNVYKLNYVPFIKSLYEKPSKVKHGLPERVVTRGNA